ncbi:hypothetical protein JCGZ_10716 [Jatropha curcas]|uniref:Uncharacterized protein n=1 Tax=Jatropha curcas TaxID=180498 RepID=A0A067KGD9_JATCU|nr:hypothetical protein JCGZ_10716 [Jatropha curcas]
MEGKFLLRDEAKINSYGKGHERIKEAKPPSSNSCSCSSLCKEQDQNCYYKAVEFSCGACLFCASCPLCVAWCCIKLPCKIGWRAAKHACGRYWTCCGSKKKVYESYSSFSDLDSDSLPSKAGKSESSYSSSKTRLKFRANELQRRRSAAES